MKSLLTNILIAGAILIPQVSSAQTCNQVISWSVGNIDRAFNLPHSELRRAAQQATSLWQAHIKNGRFEYNPQSDFKIELLNDGTHRVLQQVIRTQNWSNATKAQINQEKAAINKLKSQYQRQLSEYETRVSEFNRFIDRMNTAPRGPAMDLQAYESAQKKAEDKRVALTELLKKVKGTSALINQKVNSLNNMVHGHNQEIGNSPTLRESRAGRYIYERRSSVLGQDDVFQKIEVYRFANYDHLVWILAHEFGHALGLGHINQPGSIMSRVNRTDEISKKTARLTRADLRLLSRSCS